MLDAMLRTTIKGSRLDLQQAAGVEGHAGMLPTHPRMDRRPNLHDAFAALQACLSTKAKPGTKAALRVKVRSDVALPCGPICSASRPDIVLPWGPVCTHARASMGLCVAAVVAAPGACNMLCLL